MSTPPAGHGDWKAAREECESDRALANPKKKGKRGVDPREYHKERVRKQQIEGFTYREAVTLYLEKHCKPRQRTWTQTEGHLLRHVKHWYDRPIASITADDLRKVRDGIIAAGNDRTATLVIAWVKSLWGFLREEGKQVDPRTFDEVKKRGSVKRKREPRLYSDNDLRRLWDASGKLSVEESVYTRLTVLLAPRKTALAFMRYRDLDLATGVWTTPPELVKQTLSKEDRGRTYKTPLPAMAMREIERLTRGLPNVRVFRDVDGLTQTKAGRPLFDPLTLIKQLREAGAPDDIRLHGFRHTISTYLENQGHDEWERGLILNHTNSGVTAGYGRGYALERKRMLLEKWADHIAVVVARKAVAVLR